MLLQLLILFEKILDESNSKLNKIWVDKGSNFKIEPLRTIKQNHKFIRTVKSKTYKHVTPISKNEYIEKLTYIVTE